jgi:hypothetical protein
MLRVAARTVTLAVAVLGAAALPAERTADALRRAPVLPEESCLAAGGAEQAPPGEAAPVLVDGLGFAGLEPDSDDADARAWFAQGVRLVWAFDEAEAVRAFREAQRADPECALCFFGEAWARGPTINLQPRTEELAPARAAARRAVALSEGLGERDRFLIRGMEIRTRDGPSFGNAAYADFMEAAAARLPADDTLAILAADARMVIARSFRPGSLSQRLLERVLARNPGHGGAIHFYIHLTDWIDRQHLAVSHAERLGRIAPAASHLVHMPSHSFYGVGRYRDAAAVNVAAIAADRNYTQRVRPPRSDYRYYLNRHNMHFAIESALARGDGATATEVSRQYRAEYLGADANPASRLLGSATWYSHGLHGEVDAVLALAEPEQALEKALRHYARGEALARRGGAAAVHAEAAAIARLRAGPAATALSPGAAALAEIFQHVLEGRAAMLAGDHRAAERAYRSAMNAQRAARFGSDPPLFWYSTRRSLAAALLAGGEPRRARAQLEASLRRWPDDPLALYALSQAERALGDAAAADRHLVRARAIWAGDLETIPLARI